MKPGANHDHARPVNILGGGPAGAAAALSARALGSDVTLFERSKGPRHKVCGEFFSPEIEAELDRLGVWDSFLAAGPARIRRMALHFGTKEKSCTLPEPGWGLSRFAFDSFMLESAQKEGVILHHTAPAGEVHVIATGRNALLGDSNHCGSSARGKRQFGFKAHFEGPSDDAVELYFFDGCYVGVNAVEGGRTNVCGLGSEHYLKRFDFDYDAILEECPALAARLRPLTRSLKWLTTGPLMYWQNLRPQNRRAQNRREKIRVASSVADGPYPAGDALSFVDPFTGSGLLAAVKTGAIAGRAAAQCETLERYFEECRETLRRPFMTASLFRTVVNRGWADVLAPLVPGRVLFALTRPR